MTNRTIHRACRVASRGWQALPLALGIVTACAGPQVPVKPAPRPGPYRNIGVAPVLDLRPGAPSRTPAAETEAGVLCRGIHQGLVSALRRRGHRLSTAALPAMGLPARLPPLQIQGGVEAILLTGLTKASRLSLPEGERRELALAFGLYQARDGRMVWSRTETWSKTYPAAPDPADLVDDLLDGLLQRPVPREGSQDPLPLLHDFPPAQAPCPT